jgi:hypothetical protein
VGGSELGASRSRPLKAPIETESESKVRRAGWWGGGGNAGREQERKKDKKNKKTKKKGEKEREARVTCDVALFSSASGKKARGGFRRSAKTKHTNTRATVDELWRRGHTCTHNRTAINNALLYFRGRGCGAMWSAAGGGR